MTFKAGGLGYPESFFVERLDELKARASYEFGCDPEALTLRQLRPDALATIGVEGCGSKATYLWSGSARVMNNASS